MKNMLKPFLYVLVTVLSSSLLTGCQAVGDIFSAGVYVGIFLVVAVIIIIILVISRLGKK